MKLLWIVALTLSNLAVAQRLQKPQEQGHITGTVVNDDGDPIRYATICTVVKRTDGGSSTSCGGAEPDEHGNFDIAVPLATNGIYADSREAGYLHEDSKPGSETPVSLSASQPTTHVVLRVGVRPAKIKFTVTDRDTGKAIESFQVRWIALDDSRSFTTDFRRPLLVPANTDVVIAVTARGYKTWLYSEGNPSEPLRFHSGEEREIPAELSAVTQ